MSTSRRSRGVRLARSVALAAAFAWLDADQAAAGMPQSPARQGGRAPLKANPLGRDVIKVDGKLDEAIYSRFAPVSDFIQQEPKEGEPATERTEAWVFFDARNVYVSARCFDSHPDRMVANEMRRDNINLFENEHFAIVFDTFHDKRNAYMFYTTPLGGLFDGLVTDEGNTNRDWNTVWDAKASRDSKGWTVEFVIPFKSLRYGASGPWGVNFRRRVRWKNETSFLAFIPASFGRRGLNKISSGANLTGITPPRNSRAFEMKPYTTGGLKTDTALPKPDEWNAEFGGDAKLTLSSSLVVDLTYNTDFAQVEDDLQQVNLSRFSLVFPEKRDFFLEGQGLFTLGSQGGGGGGGGAGGGFRPVETPVLFFSRRIGLSEGVLVPIKAGARAISKVGGWSMGALQMRTGIDLARRAEHTDFSVLRLKKDILSRSTLGVIATRRDDANGTPVNLVYGGDLNLGVGSTVRITGIGARSDSGVVSSGDLFYQGRFEWNADRYGLEADHHRVEENFNPEVGIVPRPNIERDQFTARFSPRPRNPFWRRVRQFRWFGSFDNIVTASTGAFESREVQGRFETEFQSGDLVNFQLTGRRETVAEPFEVAGGLLVPVGSYRFGEFEARYRMGQQRKFAGTFVFQYGGFYGGTHTAFQFNQGRIEVNSRLSIEPQIQINRLDTPFGKATTKLFAGRLNWTMTPRMLLSTLTQYNSTTSQLATNVRFRWEYQPGSDLYVVYGDARDTLSESRPPALVSRNFVVKFTRLFRF